MRQLLSAGVDVEVIDESMYVSAAPGTTPMIVIATHSNKASPSGVGISPMTDPLNAGKLFLCTSQRDLIQNFGSPIFYTLYGTPQHGYELNEYGLWAAYSYMSIANQAYVLRADIDLGALYPAATPPVGPPIAGQYWLDLTSTRWGVFRANGRSSPGSAWDLLTVKVATSVDVANNNFGVDGDVAVAVTATADPADIEPNLLFEKVGGRWYEIGSSAWKTSHPTIVSGLATTGTLTQGDKIVISGHPVTLTGTTFSSAMADINTAAIPNITASITSGGALRLTNAVGGSITLANDPGNAGNPVTTLGLMETTYNGVSVTRNSNATWPDGSVAGSLWVKGNPSNRGAQWVIKYFNSATNQPVVLTSPFYPFVSTLLDGDETKDAAAIAALKVPVAGSTYIGYDAATGQQIPRRWSGTRWEDLDYVAMRSAPTTATAAGSVWFNPNLHMAASPLDSSSVDIMYDDGERWIGYRRMYPQSDPCGVQISGSPPLNQSDGNSPLVEGDLWIDGTDTENYPALYRWDITSRSWLAIDKTDQTTPYGIVFGDARANSGPTFPSVVNSGLYNFNSIAVGDMLLSDYLDPDAPNPVLHPQGTLLFNLRYSNNNVKKWTPTYFRAGGYSDPTDYTVETYAVGDNNFNPVDDAGRWVTASGLKQDGSPYMGRKAQRIMVVTALQAVLQANQDLRSEIVFFNLMAAPGYTELLSDFVTVNTHMKETAFIVGDTPIRLRSEASEIQNWAQNTLTSVTASGDVIQGAAVDGDDGLLTHNRFIGIYYPWGLGTNIDGTEVMVPPSALALASIAYNDQVAYPWYAPAGFNRGLVTNAVSVGYLSRESEYNAVLLNQGQRDVLYTNSINPIAFIPGRGLTIFGQKTLSPISTALDRINVARLCNYIAFHLDNILKPFLFEQNVSTTRQAAKGTCDKFFNRLISLNGLYDYVTICDQTNNTPDRVDANELWIDCAIQPVKTVEFIYVPVRILTTQAAAG